MNTFNGLDKWVNPDLKLENLNGREGMFLRQREEGEVNLVQQVRELLIAQGLGENVMHVFNTHKLIVSAEPLTTPAQQWLLNRFWDDQFMQLSVQESLDVRAMRFSLIDETPPDNWLRLFKQGMLTFISENKLPRAF